MGLISAQPMQQMPQGQPMPNPAPPQGQDDTARKRVILAATRIIYEPKTMKAILDLIRRAKTPAAGLAQATVLVMSKLVEASKNTIPQAVRTPAAKGIMALIAELSEKAGIIKDAAQAVRAASQIIAGAIMQAAKIRPEQMQARQPMAAQPAQPQMNQAQPAMGAM